MGHLGFIPHDGGRVPRWPFQRNKDSQQARGLVGWWPMQPIGAAPGTASPVIDHSINHNRGTLDAGIPGYTTTQFGGSGVYFGDDGTGSRGIILSNLNPLLTSSVTVCCWVYRTGPLNNQHVISRHPAWFLAGNSGAPNNLRFGLSTGTQTSIGIVSVASKTWALFSGRYDGANIAIFKNGISQASTTKTGVMSSSGSMRIGGYWNSDSFEWPGVLFDARIYNRALTNNEIWSIYDPATRWDLYYELGRKTYHFLAPSTISGRIMSSLVSAGGLAGRGGIAGQGGGLAG